MKTLRSVLSRTVAILFLCIVFCFLLIGSSQATNLDALIQELRHKDSSVRKRAAESLRDAKDPRVVEPLIAALKDKNQEVRSTAASALGAIGDPRAVEPLIGALK